jgi:hypothetical protein
MQNPPPMMLDHKKTVQHAEGQCQDREEVESGKYLAMVLQKREPPLGLVAVCPMTNRRATTFFMIVQRRVPRGAEVFATIAKHWSQGKNTNQENNADDMAAAMGMELLTEEQYR